jgi:adenosylcobinamide-GDP ribazoletransferase
MRTLLGDLLTVIGFFTRIPLMGPADRSLGSAIWAAPIAGLVVGIVSAATFWIAECLHLSPEIAAACAIGMGLLVTGALHEDGLADVADGFGGGATRERKLDIMRDSRIGTFGVVALIVVILAKWSALVTVGGWAAIIAAQVFSRALVPAFMLMVLPARQSGLSARAGQVSGTSALIALVLGGIALLCIGLAPAIIAAVLCTFGFVLLKYLCQRQIGGQTGDVLGTLQQISELLVLLTASAFHHPY